MSDWWCQKVVFGFYVLSQSSCLGVLLREIVNSHFYPANKYMRKVCHGKTEKRSEITSFSSASIVEFEQLNVLVKDELPWFRKGVTITPFATDTLPYKTTVYLIYSLIRGILLRKSNKSSWLFLVWNTWEITRISKTNPLPWA